jgi:hypothetical protein
VSTLIRKPAHPGAAGVLRGDTSPLMGEVTEIACRYCGGRGTYIGGDEEHICWCVRDAAADREDAIAKEIAIERALEAMDL